MKTEKDVRYWINHCSWEHGYDKAELADAAEKLFRQKRQNGFSMEIEGDILKVEKHGQWLCWTLNTGNGRKGCFKSFTYICMDDCSPHTFSRQICYALMKTSFDASLSDYQRKAEKLVEEILGYYFAFESIGTKFDRTSSKAVYQIGRKLCRLSKAETREAFYDVFIHQALDPRKEIDLDQVSEKWVKSRIDWYLLHFANH